VDKYTIEREDVMADNGGGDVLGELLSDPAVLREWNLANGFKPWARKFHAEFGHEVELVSFPWWEDGVLWVNVRLEPGEPGTLRTVKWPNLVLLDMDVAGPVTFMDFDNRDDASLVNGWLLVGRVPARIQVDSARKIRVMVPPGELKAARSMVARCDFCHRPTTYVGTRRCNTCWELEVRMKGKTELARKILDHVIKEEKS
jgi:hypothetical protein